MENKQENPFYCGSTSEQKKKKITFYTICATLALIAVTLVVFLVSLLVLSISGSDEITDIGTTQDIAVDDSVLTSGDLVPLTDKIPSAKLSALVNLEKYENRVKIYEGGPNAFTVGNKPAFFGTPEAVAALNKMIGDFYAAKKDDNIYIANAYNSYDESEQEIPYTLGTAFELKYFSAADVSDWTKKDSIYGVELYSWIYENAHNYGFLTVSELAGLKTESNVFRYVGEIHAKLMKEKKLSLPEYLSWARAYSCDEPFIENGYALYYEKEGAKITVPQNYAYTVSGNAANGDIVTVKLSKNN